MEEATMPTVEIAIDEDDNHTEARATVRVGEKEFHGWGRARRNPNDPNVPMVGEELAIARALSELSHQLLGAAADAIEAFEGHPISLRG
jgi:Rv2632c-like